MAGIPIQDGAGGPLLTVDANNRAKVSLANSDTPTQVGSVRLLSESDSGTILGTPILKSPETSDDFRLRVGVDGLWDYEQFNYAAQNTAKHNVVSTTMTAAYSGQYLTTNGASITTVTTGVRLRTYRYFPVFGAGVLYLDMQAGVTAAIPTNTIIDFGFFTDSGANPFTPTDGAYFRISSAGVFGVVNYAGAEQTSILTGFTPAPNVTYQWTITLSHNNVLFWVNDICYAQVVKPATTPQSVQAPALPLSIRHVIAGGAASSIIQFRIGSYAVTVGDIDSNRLWASAMVGMGLSAIQGASGMTQGQTSNYTNSTVPTTAAGTNIAAAYTTLGGQWQVAPVAGAETDIIMFGYQVPAQAAGVPAKNLVIRGVWIDGFNSGAANGATATVLQWGLAAGSTAVSLATAETAGTRAPRRIPLGIQTLQATAAIGVKMERVVVNLDAPIVCEPGTFVHIFYKQPIGLATASQILRGVVGVNAYWE